MASTSGAAGSDGILSVGTVTLLLGDIEGSTGLWEANHDGMFTAMGRLDELVTDSVARHRGTRPLEQGEGDSFVAGFARASDAVACATDIQRAIAKEPWPDEVDLRVRMALHVGEVRAREDGRYVGPAFNRCARIRSLAHGGQTLLSRATYDLTADAPPPNVSFLDLGEHRLRDLARPERIYQVAHPDLSADFPPLRSLTSVPNNLPMTLTTFVGRENDAAEVKRLIGEARMLTVTGAGGCGKTRLVLEVAADLVDRFPDGLWWIDLAPVADPSLLVSTVASSLGVAQVQGESPGDTLLARLDDRRMLVVLDNCEHLVSACADLAASIVTKCRDVSVLATSREALGVDGETTVRIPSLSVPEQGAATVEDIRCASVELFVDRARSARPNFRLTAENAEPIAQIVRRLDGIPLAIELAAARIRLLSPAQIAAGLSDRFHVLIGGARTALPRQRTLEASVDWSYQLLDESERTVLARLSVFAGSFDLDAAETVCAGGDIEPYDVLGLLSSLTEKSLVQVEEPEREARYRLLETIRAYARQRLADSAEATEVRTRHLDHYVAVAERAEHGLQGAAMVGWKRRLELDLDNLRVAMDHALSIGRSDEHLRLTSALLGFWVMRGVYTEIASSMEAALSASAEDPHVRAKALGVAALLSVMAGHHPSAVVLAEESVAIARESGDEATLARGLLFLGWSEFFVCKGGLEHLEEGARLAQQIGDEPSILSSLIYRGFISGWQRTVASGRPYLQEAIERAERAGNLYSVGVGAFFAGCLEVWAGRFDEADALFERSMDASGAVANQTFLAFALTFQALSAMYQGEYERARSAIDRARHESAEIGEPPAEYAEVYHCVLTWAAGDPASALVDLEHALSVFRGFGSQWYASYIGYMLGATHVALGGLAEARTRLEEAESIALDGRYRFQLMQILHVRAQIARASGDLEQAEAVAHDALHEASDWGGAPTAIDCFELLAGIAADLESYDESARLFGAAERMREEMGYRRFPVYQEAYAADVAGARAALGEDEFAARWAEGAAMSIDDALAYAVRGRGERKRPSAGWASLTSSELEVVRLVARGLPNPEIAEQLFITRNTVKTHLKHVFGTLGISSR